MSDVLRELIDEYKGRSHKNERTQPEPENPGEFFYDSSSGKLYVAGRTGQGELAWFAIWRKHHVFR